MSHIQATGFYMIHPSGTAAVKYGLQYNYYAVASGKLAPSGWHVPTKAEFDTMASDLGGYAGLSEKLREVGTAYWTSPNTGATNESGFTGRGGGYRDYSTGVFTGLGIYSYYLTSTAPYGVYMLGVHRDNNEEMNQFFKSQGASVRLIKDDSTNPGTMTDYDGNVYPTIKIGDQVFMAASLIVTHYNDGTPILEVTDNDEWVALTAGALCAYDNDWDNV